MYIYIQIYIIIYNLPVKYGSKNRDRKRLVARLEDGFAMLQPFGLAEHKPWTTTAV